MSRITRSSDEDGAERAEHRDHHADGHARRQLEAGRAQEQKNGEHREPDEEDELAERRRCASRGSRPSRPSTEPEYQPMNELSVSTSAATHASPSPGVQKLALGRRRRGFALELHQARRAPGSDPRSSGDRKSGEQEQDEEHCKRGGRARCRRARARSARAAWRARLASYARPQALAGLLGACGPSRGWGGHGA